ncbi:LegC family aminotransferase [Leptospira sp. 201903075]|uniref:LegC family aminotransferase n=1 Tax=Leptospira chreensis TaxID=2810035 RepID=UPI0019633AEA|nr:LegC family aminotransferase [Leptospira chreensis]MBM9589079.1 LegC family aminotransferase [Leptospira chreensis]
MVNEISIEQDIVKTIRGILGESPLLLHEPYFVGNEWLYLKECLDTRFVSSVGKFVDQFEKQLAEYTGSKYAIAVVNGTAALHIALKLSGVENDDEVIIPSLTFIATANAVSYCGAIPHFVDSEESHLGIDPIALREYLKSMTEFRDGKCINTQTGRVIRAIVPMHTFGHPSKLDELLALAKDFNLELIEDAAESLGSYYYGKHTGTFGKFGTLSFNGNKTITTGGGGALLTQDENLAKLAKHITTTAKLPHRWEYVHDQIGYNYRMPNINAALGCAQLESLPSFLKSKRDLYESYRRGFENLKNVELISEPRHCKSNYWLQTIKLSWEQKNLLDVRNRVLELTNDSGVMTRPVWRLLHSLKPFELCPSMPMVVAKKLEASLINIPSSAHLLPKDE